jgi:ketosteroid isomerase-like protein
MPSDPGTNLMRLGQTLEAFAGADLVVLFRSEKATERIRTALDEIAAPGLVTLMIGADRGLTGTFEGPEGFIEAWRDYSETFQELHNEPMEPVEVDSDVIYVETRQRGTTATAEIEIDYTAAAIFRFSDGRLRQAEFHLDRDAARRVVGLEPDHPATD